MSDGSTKSGILRVTRVLVGLIYVVVLAYVVILGIAFVLQLLGANPTAHFVDWVYRASSRIMEPFRGMFPTQKVSSTSVFNASLLFAILIYSFAAMLLHGAVDWLTDRIRQIQLRQQGMYAAPPAVSPPAPSTGSRVPAPAAGQAGEMGLGSPRYPA